jgi:Domain of Unknown Function (DUF928)
MFYHFRWGLAIALVLSFTTSILPPVALAFAKRSEGKPIGTIIAKGIPARWAAKRYKVPTVGSPLRREAAATRGDCPRDPLLALVPPDSISTTTQSYPTLFFRVPARSPNNAPMEFTLKYGETIVYQTKLPIVGKRQIVAISLPSTANSAPLTLDRDYQWSATLPCNNDAESAYFRTTGIIRRVAPDADLSAKLQATSVETQATNRPQVPEIYAEAEIWQDALTILANLHRLQPNNPQVTSQWRSLLESADLAGVVNDPLAP